MARILVLAVLFLLAGCAAPAQVATQSSTAAAPLRTAGTSEAEHTVSWHSADKLGNFSLEVVLELGKANLCTSHQGVAGYRERGYNAGWLSVDGDYVLRRIEVGTDGDVELFMPSAHIQGVIDTRDMLSSSGNYSYMLDYEAEFTGRVTFLTSALQAGPWATDLTHGRSFEFQLTCKEPISVVSVATGHQTRFWDGSTLDGLAHVDPMLEPGAAVGGDIVFASADPRVLVRATSDAAATAYLLETPTGMEVGAPTVLTPWILEGGAGTYHLQAPASAGYAYSTTGVIFSLVPGGITLARAPIA